MSFFEWKAEYSVNIEQIDAQHQQLVALLNHLFAAMQNGHGKEVASTTLSDLIAYTQIHFMDEERLMQTYAYPGYLAHKKEHEHLVQVVLEMQEQYMSGNQAISVPLSSFLKGWLANHILGTDRRYSSFLNEKGVR